MTITQLESQPGAFFLTNTKGVIVYATPSLTDRTEYDVPEMVGKRPGDLWGGHMDRTFYTTLWTQLAHEQAPFIGTAKNETKHGIVREERLHLAPILDSMGAPAYFLALFPALAARTDQDSFSRSFQQLFARRPQSFADIGEQFFSWLSGRSGSAKNARTCFEPIPLVEFFEQVCDAPLRERFASRTTDTARLAAAQQNPAAFRELFLAYHNDIFAYFLYRLGHDKQAAEDLTQETFCNAFSHLTTFTSRNSSYKTYLLRIAHNLLVNYFRKPTTASLDASSQDYTQEHEEAFLNKDAIVRAFTHLHAPEREIIRLFYLDEYSVHEIATLLDKTENAVKLVLSRTRKKLRALLAS